jgi:hypothetical protein
MAITFFILQGQRLFDAVAGIMGKRLKQFVGGGK